MRFWGIIIGVICLISWMLYTTLTGGSMAMGISNAISQKRAAHPETQKPAVSSPAPPPVDSTAPNHINPTLLPPVAQRAPEPVTPPLPPDVSVIVKLMNRDLPSDSTMAGLSALGVRCVFDRISRTAVLYGQGGPVEAGAQLLQSIDKVQGSCAVQTWAVFVDRNVQKGFDLAAALSAVGGSVTTASLGAGSFTLDLGADQIALALSVIADGSSVEVVQRPHVRLTHGATAKIESIQEVPIPSVAVSSGISQTSVTYRKVGLQLDITPSFLDNNRIRLDVRQQNGLIGQYVTVGASQVPVISSQTVDTVAEMTVGQTIVLGGVSTQRTRTVRGLLRNTSEVSEGALYVILSTFSEEPKAIPVQELDLDSPDGIAPLTGPLPPAEDWIDGQLLPSKGEVKRPSK